MSNSLPLELFSQGKLFDCAHTIYKSKFSSGRKFATFENELAENGLAAFNAIVNEILYKFTSYGNQ